METLEDQIINKDLVSKAMRVMSPREIEIITQLVLEERTQVECAAAFGITPPRIWQIRNRALRKAKRAIERGLFVPAQEGSFRSPEECIKFKKAAVVARRRAKIAKWRAKVVSAATQRRIDAVRAAQYQSQSYALISLARAMGYSDSQIADAL